MRISIRSFNRFLCKLLFLILTGVISTFPVHAQQPHYVIGTVAPDIPASMVRRLEPLSQYLSEQLQIPIDVRPSPDITRALKDFGQGATQIAYLTPVAYLEAREKFEATPIVVPLTQGKASFRLAVVVRKDSTMQKAADLAGKSFAFGDRKSLLQRATLESANLKLDQFAKHAYLNHFDNVAKAVLNQDFDAGIMKESLARQYEAKGLRILFTSPPFPTYVIAVNHKFPADKIPQLREALINLDAGIPQYRAILIALDPGYTGFVPAVDRQFDTVQKLIAPFKK